MEITVVEHSMRSLRGAVVDLAAKAGPKVTFGVFAAALSPFLITLLAYKTWSCFPEKMRPTVLSFASFMWERCVSAKKHSSI
ncbi:MAG: hypothetical protein LVR00_07195 [Rhabdochlamydiaceae bacterium]|jgi:hypothetical protein